MNRWSADNLPDLSGRTFVVTGATSGLGEQTATALTRVGARTVLAVRDVTKGERLAARLEGENVEVRRLDLADLGSVRAFAETWDGPIDVLINNAGVMAIPEARSVDGFELQLATNHLGPFLLTNLLRDRITDRVVTVSSGLHRSAGFDLDDLNWGRRRYNAWQAYAQTKLANLLFTLELQRRLSEQGSRVRAMAAHPGYAATNLQSGLANPWQDRALGIANRLFAQSAEMGALPTLFVATLDLPGGSYAGPGGRGGRGYPTLVGRSADASDPDLAARLWSESERLLASVT